MQAARALIPRQARQVPRSLFTNNIQPSVRILVLTRRNYAAKATTPVTPETPVAQKDPVPPFSPVTVKSPGLENYMAGANKVPGSTVNPYKDGPSALDKAMTSFLFTELVRGENLC